MGDKRPPFWLVWNPNGRQPRFRHDCYREARDEAERLARRHPGNTFYVLTPVARGCTSDHVVWAHYEPMGISTIDDGNEHGPQPEDTPNEQ